MQKALGTYVAANQELAVNDVIAVTKYAGRPCNGLSIANNGIAIKPAGTYNISGYVNIAATAEGNVEIALYNNGVVIPNTQVTVTAAGAGDVVALPIKYTIYNPPKVCPLQASNYPVITVVLLEGPGTTSGGIIDVEM